jgi:hypothetical protein
MQLEKNEDEEEEEGEGEGEENGGGDGAENGEQPPAERPKSPPLPMPSKPNCMYVMNRTDGSMWDKRQVMYLSGGATVCAGDARTGRYVCVTGQRHTLHLRKDLHDDRGDASVYALSVTYEDSLCVIARRSGKKGTLLSIGFPDGLHVTVRCVCMYVCMYVEHITVRCVCMHVCTWSIHNFQMCSFIGNDNMTCIHICTLSVDFRSWRQSVAICM